MIHTNGCKARVRLTLKCTCELRDYPKLDYGFLLPPRLEIPFVNLYEAWKTPMTNERNFKHAMIDIETMSTHPSNALILSCALLPFDPEHRERLVLGKSYHWRFELVPQLIAGRQVDRSTQDFWSDQPMEAQLRLLTGKLVTVPEFRSDLAAALDGVESLWARGIVFDIGNLATLFRDNGLVEPWRYNAPDDVRTITRHTPKTRIGDIDSHGFVAEIIPHDPVSDCIQQAHEVWEHWGVDASRAAPIAHHPV